MNRLRIEDNSQFGFYTTGPESINPRNGEGLILVSNITQGFVN